MQQRLFLPEVFSKLATIDNFEDQVSFIRGQRNPALEMVFHYVFSPQYIFNVEVPKYKQNQVPLGFGDVNLFSEIRRLYIFTTVSKVDTNRKKKLLAALLSELSKEEAKLIEDIITGKVRNYTNVTEKLVSTLYPQIPISQVVENKEIEKVEKPEIKVPDVEKKNPEVKEKKKAKKCPNCPHYESSHNSIGCKKCGCKLVKE